MPTEPISNGVSHAEQEDGHTGKTKLSLGDPEMAGAGEKQALSEAFSVYIQNELEKMAG